jgi:NADPH-dependent 7-cyano-7-deazaguanine reductase QueF
MINNIQSITLIEADKRISLYCPIGKDYYTADVYIKLIPDNHYMDYMDLDKFLNDMSGLSLTIEAAVDKIYEEIQRYKPMKTKVMIEAFSNTHLHVKVTKGDDI